MVTLSGLQPRARSNHRTIVLPLSHLYKSTYLDPTLIYTLLSVGNENQYVLVVMQDGHDTHCLDCNFPLEASSNQRPSNQRYQQSATLWGI